MAETQEPAQRDLYEEARALIFGTRGASLATVTEAVPYAAWVTPAFMTDGSAVLLLSQLSAHTRHLQANGACALLLVGQASDENPQTAPRICLTGTAEIVAGHLVRTDYLAVHPYAALYMDFTDFSFWRVVFSTAHYIGGFAAASRLDIRRLLTT